MPTYKNISKKEKSVQSMDGRARTLSAGESGETLIFYDDPDLELVSREPLFRKVLDISQVLAANNTYVDLSPLCDYVFVDQIDGEITVLAEADSEANRIPLLKDRTKSHPVIVLEMYGVYDRLIIQGTGTCSVTQLRAFPGLKN
jgi:hypothetical protein